MRLDVVGQNPVAHRLYLMEDFPPINMTIGF